MKKIQKLLSLENKNLGYMKYNHSKNVKQSEFDCLAKQRECQFAILLHPKNTNAKNPVNLNWNQVSHMNIIKQKQSQCIASDFKAVLL